MAVKHFKVSLTENENILVQNLYFGSKSFHKATLKKTLFPVERVGPNVFIREGGKFFLKKIFVDNFRENNVKKIKFVYVCFYVY